MYCTKCGNFVDDGQEFCGMCGANIKELANTKPSEPVENIVDSAAIDTDLQSEAVAESVIDTVESEQPDSTENTPKKPKNKKKRIIISSIAAALSAAVVCVCVFAWDYIENFFVQLFSSPEGYYQYVEGKNIDKLSSSVGGIVGLLDSESQHTVNASAKVKLGDKAIDLLAQKSGMNKSDLEWASSVGINLNSARANGLISENLDFTVNNSSVVGANVVFDSNENILYLCVPQVNGKYAMIDLSDVLPKSSNNDSVLSASDLSGISSSMPSEAVVTDIVARYLTVAIETIDGVEENSVTIKANGVSQDCTQLSYVIDDDTLEDIVVAVLNEFVSDEEIKGIVEGIAISSGEVTSSDFEDLWDGVIEDTEELIDEVDFDFDGFEFEVVTYVDNRGEIIGREINADGESVYYYTTYDDGDVGFELVAADLEILGSGVVDGDYMNGSYDVFVRDVKVLEIDATNYDVDKAQDGYIDGTFTLSVPKNACGHLISAGIIPSDLADYVADAAVSLKISTSEEGFFISAALLYKNDMYITLELSLNSSNNANVSVPSDAIEINHQNDLEEYVSGFDPEEFLDDLRDVGFPVDLFLGTSQKTNDSFYY